MMYFYNFRGKKKLHTQYIFSIASQNLKQKATVPGFFHNGINPDYFLPKVVMVCRFVRGKWSLSLLTWLWRFSVVAKVPMLVRATSSWISAVVWPLCCTAPPKQKYTQGLNASLSTFKLSIRQKTDNVVLVQYLQWTQDGSRTIQMFNKRSPLSSTQMNYWQFQVHSTTYHWGTPSPAPLRRGPSGVFWHCVSFCSKTWAPEQ